MKRALIIISLLFAIPAVGQNLATEEGKVLSFDGLVEIKSQRFAMAWIDPEVDLSHYNSVMPGGAEFEFRAVKKASPPPQRRQRNAPEYYISDSNRQKLKEEVGAAFNREMAKVEGWEFVEEPGPDTLIISGMLLDIVSYMPSSVSNTSMVHLSAVGEATLVIEARDSLSGEVLFRALDRRRAETRGGGTLTSANAINGWADVRRWADHWAVRLREGLESIREP